MSLITVTPPESTLSPALLDARGGFAWWYVDLLDERGNGLVAIWSFGLPFLPGYASSHRANRPQRAGDRPSLNIACYREGQLDFYLLQEYPRDDVSWVTHSPDHTSWRFGDTRFEFTRHDQKLTLEAFFDAPVPASDHRFKGYLRVDGVARRQAETAPTQFAAQTNHQSDHDWSPLTGPAEGTLDVRVGDWSLWAHGRAYHDRNGSQRALHDLGIDRWYWGRLPFADRELIYYVLWPESGSSPVAIGIEVFADGTTRQLDNLTVTLRDETRDWAGLTWHRRIELSHEGQPWLTLDHDRLVDSGPFYLRMFTTARRGSEKALGVSEFVKPDRVDLALHRPFVEMRVHRVATANSHALALFNGPRATRLGRFARTMLARVGAADPRHALNAPLTPGMTSTASPTPLLAAREPRAI